MTREWFKAPMYIDDDDDGGDVEMPSYSNRKIVAKNGQGNALDEAWEYFDQGRISEAYHLCVSFIRAGGITDPDAVL